MSPMDPSIIYLDYNATTPMDPQVVEEMLPFLRETFANASSRQHEPGRGAARAVDRAAGRVAQAINADPREIVWTSGATESNNLALKGVLEAPAYRRKSRRIVTPLSEHRAVLDPCRRLEEEEGVEVAYLPVDRDGRLDLNRLREALSVPTLLVSIMHANNETGVLQDIREIGRLCRERGVLFHTDATQSFGKEPIDVEDFSIDLLSLSGHKIYAAKGVGALYVRRKRSRVRCSPLLDGGGHQRGLRSGTLNVPGIVSLGAAAKSCLAETESSNRRIADLRDRLEKQLGFRLKGVTINGATCSRLAGTSNLRFAGIDAEQLLERLPGIACSSSSACTSATFQPSHVLAAMGLDDDAVRASVRFSLGRFTTGREIDLAIERIVQAVDETRQVASPAHQCSW